MAKGSKKGACSAHVDAAKANCLKHDRREGKIPSYVNPHLTHTNRTVFEDEMIRGRKSITPLVNRAEKLYTEKTGQKCQKSFAPFREDVLRIKAGITDDQLLAFKDQVEKATGWKVVGIWLHQDEGHYHSKYIEGDENYAINYHAHVLYSCQDQETGKAIRLGRNYFRLRQDWLAEATGMERGNSAAETGIRHRSSQQQRIETQEERLSQLHDAALIEGIKGKFGLSSKDAKIRQEKGKNKALRQQLAEVPAQLAAAKAEGATIAKKAANTEAARVDAAHRNEVTALKAQINSLAAARDDAIAKANNAAQDKAKAVEREKKAIGEVKKAQHELGTYKNLMNKFWKGFNEALSAIMQYARKWDEVTILDHRLRVIDDALNDADVKLRQRKGYILIETAKDMAETDEQRQKVERIRDVVDDVAVHGLYGHRDQEQNQERTKGRGI